MSRIETVAVVGAGAVGGYYGCRIQEAGRRVKFLLRSELEEVREKGFEVRSVEGDLRVDAPEVFGSAEEMGPVDLVIVAWKATSNDKAVEVIGPLLHEGTRVLTLQNGLGNVELLKGLFGEGRVVGGICFVCLNRLGGGVISHTAGGSVILGEFHKTGVLDELPGVFGEKVDARVVGDLGLAQWRKLVWNVPFNGLCVSEGGVTTEELLSRAGKEDEVRALMWEVIRAAAGLGYEIPERFMEDQLARTKKMGAYKPSTMIVFVEGRPIEVEAIWGEPVRRSKAAGVEVPRMEGLYERLRSL